MIVQVGTKIYHDEHDITVKISNDNTKHVKICSVVVKSDGDWDEALTKALQLYKDGVS